MKFATILLGALSTLTVAIPALKDDKSFKVEVRTNADIFQATRLVPSPTHIVVSPIDKRDFRIAASLVPVSKDKQSVGIAEPEPPYNDDEITASALEATPIDRTPTSAKAMGLEMRANRATVAVTMSNLKMHVGDISLDEMYWFVTDCLRETCPGEKAGLDVCTRQPPKQCFWKVHEILFGKVGTGDLRITVRSAYFPPNHVGIREGLIKAMASTFFSMMHDNKNCYEREQDGKKYRFCNVGRLVMVMLRDFGIDGWERAHLTVSMVFARKIDGDEAIGNPSGSFDCEAVKEQAKKQVMDSAGEDLSKGVGQDRSSLDYKMHCVKAE